MRSLGWLGLIFGIAALACLTLPMPGMFFAMGLGSFGGAVGFAGYRRTADSGGARLAGAGAVTLGFCAVVLSVMKYGLTLAAIGRIERLF